MPGPRFQKPAKTYREVSKFKRFLKNTKYVILNGNWKLSQIQGTKYNEFQRPFCPQKCPSDTFSANMRKRIFFPPVPTMVAPSVNVYIMLSKNWKFVGLINSRIYVAADIFYIHTLKVFRNVWVQMQLIRGMICCWQYIILYGNVWNCYLNILGERRKINVFLFSKTIMQVGN